MMAVAGAAPGRGPVSRFVTVQAAAEGYNTTLDYLRFGAACAIVLFHAGVTPTGTDQSAVGLFAIALVYLTTASVEAKQPDLRGYARQRARRLIYPMLIWGGLHLTAKAASVGFNPGALRTEFAGWFPPDGTMAQLWFLPWAFAVSVGLACLARLHLPKPRPTWPEALRFAFLSAVGASVPLMVWNWIDMPRFYGVLILYGCSAVIGLSMYVVRDHPRHVWLTVLGLVGTGIALRLSGIAGTEQMVVAAPLFALAMTLRLPGVRLARLAGTMSFSLYLVHVLVIAVLSGLLGVAADTVLGAALALAVSLAVALALRRTRLDRWLT